jgi:hypothetical protein
MPFEGEKFEEIPTPPPEEEKEEEIEEEKLEGVEEKLDIEELVKKLEEEKGTIEVKMGFEERKLAAEYQEIDEKGIKGEEEMNRFKLRIRREYEETDPRAPERMIDNLEKERQELIWKAEEYEEKLKEPGADIATLQVAIDSFKRKTSELEHISFEYRVARNPRPLKAYAEECLDNLLKKDNKWRGREGFEKLQEALFLKRNINTIEWQLEKELELEE